MVARTYFCQKDIWMRIFFIGFLCVCSISLSAQTGNADLSTPQNAVITHLYHLQPEHFNDSIAAIPFHWEGMTFKESKVLSIKLKRILDGKGIYIDTKEIPKDPNYIDSISHKSRYELVAAYPEIYLVKEKNGDWKFSQRSLEKINELYGATFRFGTGRLLQLLPKLGTKKYLGIYSYQYIAILILAMISAVIYTLFIFFTEKVISRLLLKTGYEGESKKINKQIAKPTSVFIIVLLLIILVPALQLPINISKYVHLILGVLAPIFGTIIVYRIINIVSLSLERMARKTESSLDDQLVPLLRKTLKTFVILVGTLLIMDRLNVPILPLLTGLSLGGLAFALAAQDTIKNFFGSVMIFVDKPFQVGDWITAGTVDGTVEEVGLRSSRIRTFRNSLIYVPNGKLADNTIDNHGLRKYRRFYTHITITYDTPPDLIELFVKGLREIVEQHPHTWKDNYHVYLNEMSSSSLNIMFYIFFSVPTWGDELNARHEVLMKIIRLANEIGINFAFPTQTVHVENLPGQPSLSPNYLSEAEAEKKLHSYFQTSQ